MERLVKRPPLKRNMLPMNRSSLKPLLIIGTLLCSFVCFRDVSAGLGEVEIASVQIGFGGAYKLGQCTPVRISVVGDWAGQPIRAELTSQDGEGVPTTFMLVDQTVQQDATGAFTIGGYIKPGQAHGDLTVRLISESAEIAHRVFPGGSLPSPLASTDELILTYGNAVGIEDAAIKARRDRSRETKVQAIDDPADAPAQWYGYEGVDWIVVTTSDESVLERMSDVQFAALDRWLQLGGRMVLCVGRRGEEIFAPGSRLTRFAPGGDAQVVSQRITSGLENYAGANDRLDVVGGERSRRFSIPMTSLSGVRGEVESDEIGGVAGRLPTIVRSPYGMGQIVFLAFDPDLPPFDQWQGRSAMMIRVLRMTDPGRQREADDGALSGQLGQLGYQDVIGQLRSALDQFENTTRVRFSWVAGLIAIYILLIGPGDYLLLKKFQRMHWTWFTFPLLSILFCLLIYFLVGRLSGDTLHINQVDVVDVDMESSVARGTSWTHIYSPVAQTFQLSLRPHAPWMESDNDIQGRLLTWQGLPGGGLGGLDAGSPSALFPNAYEILLSDGQKGGRGGTVVDMPITVSGSKSLLGQWWSQGELTADHHLTVNHNGLLEGSLSNPLSIELSDCRVLYQDWMYPINGGLKPGQTVAFDGVMPKNLQWYLMRRRVVDSKDVKMTWDPSNTDVPRIVEMMMFYGAADGEAYTKLTHRYQSNIDLSDHLRGGRVILVGRGPKPASELSRGDASLMANYDRHWTFYRLIFPVDQPERP